MLSLGVSTSTHRGSVAIVDGPELLAQVYYDAQSGHAEQLFGAIDRVLMEAQASRADLGLIACDVGPGSFTGVRVGVAAMQGAAKALRIPTVGVTSLEAIALGGRLLGHDRALVMLDAKKSEVFFALFTPELTTEPSHVGIAALDDLVRMRDEHHAVVFGEIASSFDGWSPIRGATLDLPAAELVARSGIAKTGQLNAILTPLYVRAPDAKPNQP
jgi:tRNA threonylcarbamoyladenosine biosynthesis protein TsaB